MYICSYLSQLIQHRCSREAVVKNTSLELYTLHITLPSLHVPPDKALYMFSGWTIKPKDEIVCSEYAVK